LSIVLSGLAFFERSGQSTNYFDQLFRIFLLRGFLSQNLPI